MADGRDVWSAHGAERACFGLGKLETGAVRARAASTSTRGRPARIIMMDGIQDDMWRYALRTTCYPLRATAGCSSASIMLVIYRRPRLYRQCIPAIQNGATSTASSSKLTLRRPRPNANLRRRRALAVINDRA